MRLLAGILAMVMLFALPLSAGSEGETGEHPVILLTGDEGAAQTLESVLNTMTVE